MLRQLGFPKTMYIDDVRDFPTKLVQEREEERE